MGSKIHHTILPLLIGLMLAGATAQAFQGDACTKSACCCQPLEADAHQGIPSDCCPPEASCCHAESVPDRAGKTVPIPSSQSLKDWTPILQSIFFKGSETLPAPNHPPGSTCPQMTEGAGIPIYLWNLTILR